MEKKTTNLIFLGISLAITAAFIIFIIPKRVYHRSEFLFSSFYAYTTYIMLAIGLIILMLRVFMKKKIKSKLISILYGLLFLPIAIFPAIRCYFKVPYIFCKACPIKCPWGVLAPVIIPSFLVLNLDKRLWCFQMCPFGTIQDYQCKCVKKTVCLPKWLTNIRYLFLVFTLVVVVGLFINLNWLSWFLKETHHLYAWSLTIAAIIFILAFFIPRFWCNYFCPIGSFGDIALKIEKKVKK